MGNAFVPGLRADRAAIVRRVRELPVLGETLPQVGEMVQSTQVVARAELAGELVILRVAEKLGIEPHEVIEGLKVREGDVIHEGQLLCEHRGLFGLFRNQFTSPASGVLELISPRTGHIGIRASAVPMEILAYLSGKVVSVAQGKGVEIESTATFVQGIFGVGGERYGTIRMLSAPPDEELQDLHIPENAAGAILVGGARPTVAALRRAAELGAQGLVTASIDDATLREYLGYDIGIALTGDERVPLTLIVTEGFGKLELSARVRELLAECEGMSAAINGATQVRAGAVRPEIVVARPELVAEARTVDARGLAIGALVRIIRVPYFGARGTVVALPDAPQRIPTGALTRVANVRLEGGEEVCVPRANLELL